MTIQVPYPEFPAWLPFAKRAQAAQMPSSALRLDQQILLEENEVKPNRFVANAMLCVLAAALAVEFLNEVRIFTVDLFSMRFCMLSVVMCSLVVQAMGRIGQFSRCPASKFGILGLVVLETLLIATALGQWAELFMFLPLLLALQYHDRSMTRWAYAGSLLTALLAAPLGCLLRLPQAEYYAFLLSSCGVLVGELCPDPAYDLGSYLLSTFRFQSLSRCLLVAAVGMIAFSISRQTSLNVSKRAVSSLRSHTDVLTGLQNRLSFEETLSELEETRPDHLYCFYADADGLHHLNDTQGHAAGDALLIAGAATLRAVLGQTTFRVGGDEFVALITAESAEAAFQKRLRIEQEMAQKGYHLSIGVSELARGISVQSMLKAAEQDMYAVKSAYYASIGLERRRY